MPKYIKGFSKKTKREKVEWLLDTHDFKNQEEVSHVLRQYLHDDLQLQQLHDEFSENVISNYYLPYAIAPNFLINGKLFTIPMVIEESSVVAAACKSANFWYDRGGFKAAVRGTEKSGHVHFNYRGDKQVLIHFFKEVKPLLLQSTETLTRGMRTRGGGITEVELVDKTHLLKGYYQLKGRFETLDAMGANFINSCLEVFAKTFLQQAHSYFGFMAKGHYPEVTMSILSNYVPECLVRAEVACLITEKPSKNSVSRAFAERFVRAVQIAEVETYRAVTHNKGVMNGVDAVILATANDFRAIEAGIHAYAAREGKYSSLTHATIEKDKFSFYIEIPVNVGTVGGVTALHPLAKLSLELLGHPSSKEFMEVIAVAGLAQNFAALRSLTTTGIQQGHMRMHLVNILNQLGASEKEKTLLIAYFEQQTLSHSLVANALQDLRNGKLKL